MNFLSVSVYHYNFQLFLYYKQVMKYFFPFGATAHIWALAYLHETFRFTSVY
jgi:hypothetical protein